MAAVSNGGVLTSATSLTPVVQQCRWAVTPAAYQYCTARVLQVGSANLWFFVAVCLQGLSGGSEQLQWQHSACTSSTSSIGSPEYLDTPQLMSHFRLTSTGTQPWAGPRSGDSEPPASPIDAAFCLMQVASDSFLQVT